MPARNHIDLVVKVMNVLETMAKSETGMSLKDISIEVGQVKSSVFRILYTLKQIGYVEQASENGAYRLTLKMLGLARRSTERPSLITVARPYLMRLRDQLRESAWLAERRRRVVILVDVAESAHPLRLSFDVGDPCPLHATALGKAVAAFLSPEEVEFYLGREKLPKYTPHTLTNRAELRDEFAKVRRLGYSVNEEETIEGAVLFGAPIFDAVGRAFAAMSVSAPMARCSPERRKIMVRELMAVSSAVTADLSHLGFRSVDASGSGTGA